MTTRYTIEGNLAHVEVDGVDRGTLLIHRKGYCVSCDEPSRWPLCAECHDAVLDFPAPQPTREQM